MHRTYELKYRGPIGDVAIHGEFGSDEAALREARRLSERLDCTVRIARGVCLGVMVATPDDVVFLPVDRIIDAPEMSGLKRWDGLPMVLKPLRGLLG